MPRYTYHSYGFHGEHRQAEKRRERFQRPHGRPVGDAGQVPHQIIERDAQTAGHQQVGHHGHRRQILEVRYVAEQYERYEQHGDEVSDVRLFIFRNAVVIDEQLLAVSGDNDGVHAARAKVRDE